MWSHRTEATEEENKSRKTLEKAVREETLWRDQPLENEPASKGDGPSKGINKNVVDSIRTKELKRVKRQIQELKFRAQDATRRAEIAWKLREARTASDSFCALFPDKDKVRVN